MWSSKTQLSFRASPTSSRADMAKISACQKIRTDRRLSALYSRLEGRHTQYTYIHTLYHSKICTQITYFHHIPLFDSELKEYWYCFRPCLLPPMCLHAYVHILYSKPNIQCIYLISLGGAERWFSNLHGYCAVLCIHN